MTIGDFTPWSALAGGLMLGSGALLLLLIEGRIAGISGILAGLLSPRRGELMWRILFLAGLVLGAGGAFAVELSPRPVLEVSPSWLLSAGLLVGLGAKLGNGCTSGHGICGIGRLSLRSVVATLTFMASGFITVFLLRHGL